MLLPARVHQERERVVAALRTELAAIIAALPTAGTGQGQGATARTSLPRNPREIEDEPS